jgi:hypothetical protein
LKRLVVLAVAVAGAESAWAYYAAATSVPLALFYGVILATSVLFFVPGLVEDRSKSGHKEKA